MKKDKVKILIGMIVVFIVGVIVGVTAYHFISKKDSTNDTIKETEVSNDKKESPYTLEEIYAIIENPERFYELAYPIDGNISFILCRFYDYFSESTPFKVATKVELDDHHRVSKVLEVDYISYEEYRVRNSAYEDEYRNKQVMCDEGLFDDEICHHPKYGIWNIMYNPFAENLVYGEARSLA